MKPMMLPLLATLGASALVVGCSGPDTGPDTGPGADPATTGEITVFAAASLVAPFTAIAEQFEAEQPGTTVNVNFAGSSDLVTQLTQGAPADVFAAADADSMGRAVEAGLVAGEPVAFATNTLTIVTLPGNPKDIASFADLADPEVTTVVCAPQVPCGAATERVETVTGVALSPVSEESAVTDVLGKIISGQADAGLVYRTDAKGAGAAVTEIPFPESADAVNRYPIALLEESDHQPAARAFIDVITGPAGQDILAEAGFAAP